MKNNVNKEGGCCQHKGIVFLVNSNTDDNNNSSDSRISNGGEGVSGQRSAANAWMMIG